jgi:DNA polymerase-3 subunit alpha
MDFLGLRTLTVIADALRSIELSGESPPDLERVPFDDPEVFDLFCRGDTDGIFQFESSGMKELLRKVHPRVFADLAALNALYRPGPMQFIDDFTARKHGRKPITYIFPELEEILGETYGIIVYQEQVMRIAVHIAGFTMAQADLLRKAMGKKKQDIIAREGETFIQGAVKKSFPEDKVRKLWDQIVPFAMYGFNKSHSVAYAHVAYLTAYLKVHFPAHFMAAMLTSEAANTDKLAMYLARSRHMGIEILPPDINASLNMFTVESNAIRFGLVAVKGVGESAVEAVLEARAEQGRFTGVAHFLRSLPPRAANHKVVECLAKAGCFDQFGLSRGAVVSHLDQLMEAAASEREERELGQSLLFEELGADSYEAGLKGEPEVDAVTRLSWEREVLGFYLSGHPLDRYRPQLRRFSDCEIGKLAERVASDESTVAVGGLVAGLRVNQIRKEGPNQGRRLASFQLEDPSGSVRVVAFPDTFERYRSVLTNDVPVLVVAALRGEDEHPELIAESISQLDAIDSERAEGVRIQLNLEEVEETSLEELREFLLEHSGPLPVRFELLRPGSFRATLAPPPALTVRSDEEFLQGLEERVGSGRAQLVFPARRSAAH